MTSGHVSFSGATVRTVTTPLPYPRQHHSNRLRPPTLRLAGFPLTRSVSTAVPDGQSLPRRRRSGSAPAARVRPAPIGRQPCAGAGARSQRGSVSRPDAHRSGGADGPARTSTATRANRPDRQTSGQRQTSPQTRRTARNDGRKSQAYRDSQSTDYRQTHHRRNHRRTESHRVQTTDRHITDGITDGLRVTEYRLQTDTSQTESQTDRDSTSTDRQTHYRRNHRQNETHIVRTGRWNHRRTQLKGRQTDGITGGLDSQALTDSSRPYPCHIRPLL